MVNKRTNYNKMTKEEAQKIIDNSKGMTKRKWNRLRYVVIYGKSKFDINDNKLKKQLG